MLSTLRNRCPDARCPRRPDWSGRPDAAFQNYGNPSDGRADCPAGRGVSGPAAGRAHIAAQRPRLAPPRGRRSAAGSPSIRTCRDGGKMPPALRDLSSVVQFGVGRQTRGCAVRGAHRSAAARPAPWNPRARESSTESRLLRTARTRESAAQLTAASPHSTHSAVGEPRTRDHDVRDGYAATSEPPGRRGRSSRRGLDGERPEARARHAVSD